LIQSLTDSPFAALSLIVAPAMLTNASSLLALGTSNRFARAVDRQRQLSALLEKDGENMTPAEGDLRLRQLRRTEIRGQLLLRTLTSFYLSLGAFAAASFLSLIGAVISPLPIPSIIIAVLAMVAGLTCIVGLVTGSVRVVRETRLALESLEEEAAFTQLWLKARVPPPV